MKQFIFTRPFEVETKGNDVFLDGFISTTDKDLVNDVITKACLRSMLSQIQEKNIKLDLEHESFRGDSHEEKEINKTKVPIGRIVDGTLSENKLRVKAKINRFHPRFDETKGSLQEGFLDAFSIAYIPKKIAMEEKNGEEIRMVDDLTLLNVALTGNPVNTSAQIREVMVKSMDAIEAKPLPRSTEGIPTSTEANVEEDDEEDEDGKKKKKKKTRADTLRQARNEALEADEETKPCDKKPGKKDAMDQFNQENKELLEVKDSFSRNSDSYNDKEVKNMTEEQETAQVKDEEVVTPEEPKEPTPEEPTEPTPEPKPEPTPAENPVEEIKTLKAEIEALRKDLKKVNSKAIQEQMPKQLLEKKAIEPLDVIQ